MRVEVLPGSGDGRPEERDRHAVPEQAPEHCDTQGGICHKDRGEAAVLLHVGL